MTSTEKPKSVSGGYLWFDTIEPHFRWTMIVTIKYVPKIMQLFIKASAYFRVLEH